MQGTNRVDASGRDELYEAVQEWRLQNQVPVGNVIQDVDNFTCARHPMQCQGVVDGQSLEKPIYYAPNKGQRFIDKLTSWANSMIRSSAISNLEPHEIAQARAKICIACPRNTEWRNGCGNCVSNAQRLFTMICKGKSIKDIGDKVKGCTSYNHCNSTAVWLLPEAFKDVPSTDVPSACWVPKLK